MKNQPKPNFTKTLIICAIAFAASIALTIAAVPLYYLFCQQFGIPIPSIQVGQTPQQTEPIQPTNRTVTIRFMAKTAAGLPMGFEPITYTQTVNLGQPTLTAYKAQNFSNSGIDGVAVHMLYAMGGPSGTNLNDYITLQQCFCFEEQHYPAQSDIRLPLSFV
ncbi:MAG: hypothetical protein EBR79_02995, partial [Proteobacteria bacterium]|nr:hypothetical protein [Pseudomonadota bacterium]